MSMLEEDQKLFTELLNMLKGFVRDSAHIKVFDGYQERSCLCRSRSIYGQ